VRILIAVGEAVFNSYLAATLSAEGWEVRVASAGNQAIDIGVTFRPQVLIADWLLQDRADGLVVSNALRTVDPHLQTIMITSCCTADFRAEALAGGVFRIIEKPAPLGVIVGAVNDAVSGLSPGDPPALIPVATVEADGRIVHVNPSATKLFGRSKSGSHVANITDLFDEVVIDRLGASTQAWVEVTPLVGDSRRWRVRSRRIDVTWLFVILESAETDLRNHCVLRPLLDISAAPSSRWPFDESLMIVDKSLVHRKVLSDALDEIGSRCLRAETPEMAMKLLEANPDVGAIVLDCAWPGIDAATFVRELKSVIPGVAVVGTGVQQCDLDLKEAGVDCFLSYPWSLDQLANAIREARDSCGV